MVKTIVTVLALIVSGTATAAGWRDLRVDGSSEEAFAKSVALLQDKLSPSRRVAFAVSLQDIWFHGSRLAEEQQREYTQADYFRQLDGLTYEEVVRVTDPTGKKAKGYRARYYYSRGGGGAQNGQAPWPQSSPWPQRQPPKVNEQTCRGCGPAIGAPPQ
jgi:hypothetical protein